MNLAEIRKKAQQEKKESSTFCIEPEEADLLSGPAAMEDEVPDPSAAEPEAFSLPDEPETECADEPEAEAMVEDYGLPHMPEHAVPEAGEPSSGDGDMAGNDHVMDCSGQKGPERGRHFDPMALILAGRQQAQDEEDLISADASAKEDTGFQEFLCFRVSSEIYAINILDIKEIIKPRDVTEVPRVPSFISGVLSLRGIIIPVFNMRVRLGLPVVTGHAKERVLVIKKDEELCGLVVDEVVQVVRITASNIEPPPAVLDSIDREFVSGIGRHDGMMLILLNLRSILDINLR